MKRVTENSFGSQLSSIPTYNPSAPWEKFARLTEKWQQRCDLALMNLACATDLPGTENVDLGKCLALLDDYTERVRWRTTQALSSHFERHPERYQRNEAYFRMLTLVTVLQRDCGVRYNPAKIPEDAPFEVADTFIHGALVGNGGTCASLPVIYVAIGRRLGYPLRLVSARGGKYEHSFARWDEPGRRFNIEATAAGLSCPPDDHYRTGLYTTDREAEERGQFLQSQTSRESLAMFLIARGQWWQELNRHRQAVEAMAWACALAPRNEFYLGTLQIVLNLWNRLLKSRRPAIFPDIFITSKKRRFPSTLEVFSKGVF